MQVKIVIGTLSFMLVMVILGVAALLEPARLEETTEAFEGRQIENGAVLFSSNCAECHGKEGMAIDCVDASGEPKGCVGLPLNHVGLLCGEPSERMVQLGWLNSKEALIRQTIAAGRVGTVMPVWSQEYGGPLEDHQVDQLTTFVLNWGNDPALCGEGVEIVTVEWPDTAEELPEGNPENGPNLYEVTYGCAACHGDPAGDASTAVVGPWLGNIGNEAGTRVQGQSAAQYIYMSILHPNDFMAPECPNAPCTSPSAMPANFNARMNEQDMADLIAYYLTLTNEP